MSRSAFRPVVPAVLAGVLVASLTVCGAAEAPAAAGSDVSTSASGPSSTDRSTPTSVATTSAGASTPTRPAPDTGIDGTAKGGICTWRTPQQVARLEPRFAKIAAGVLDIEVREGVARRRCTWTDGFSHVRVASYTLPSKAEADAFMTGPSKVHKVVTGLGSPASYDAEPTPTSWNQYLTIRHSDTVVHAVVVVTQRPKGVEVTDPKARPDLSAVMVAIAREIDL